ncbi:hypothetical protein D3C87_1267090 [compost metagenome]|jgi:hypothetical protein
MSAFQFKNAVGSVAGGHGLFAGLVSFTPIPFPGSDLVKSTNLYNVDKEVSILSDIEFKDGRKYGY